MPPLEAIPSEPDVYPRPQLRRGGAWSLDGQWEFALDREGALSVDEVQWERTIRVPFAPETPLSGVADTGYYSGCWYQREFEPPALREGDRLLLHFGAVDYAARVWVNGATVAEHEGGYAPFTADITSALVAGGPQSIVVYADDDPHDLAKPRGKQDWFLEPHGVWYPRTTGIWQTVWLERIGATSIAGLRWASNLDRWEIALEASVAGPPRDDLRLNVRMSAHGKLLADDTYAVIAGEVTRRIALSDPGIDDYRNELLWSPRRPTLIEAELRLLDGAGAVLDAVSSYTALRSFAIDGERLLMNGWPIRLRMVLDQGYWPEGGLTAPEPSALRRDVELARAMGFNAVRKHQKIEDPRYLYWADRLGLLVWEEMPSAYRFTARSVKRLMQEWMEVIDRDFSHPCIITRVPFNESWGVPDLPSNPAQRHYVQAMYQLTKTLDPDRTIVGNDGWESVATDIIGIHDYDSDPSRIAKRYETREMIPELFERERPAGRRLTIEGHPHAGQPIVLSEFGGRFFGDDRSQSFYSRSDTVEDFARTYQRLLEVVRSLPLFAGFCYTQFADCYQETNGLLYADRTPKIPIDTIAAATLGRPPLRDAAASGERGRRPQPRDATRAHGRSRT